MQDLFRRMSPTTSSFILSLAILGLFVLISALFIPNFFSPVNLSNIARLYAPAGIMALGLSVVLISGEIDVSVGAIASLAVLTATRFIDTSETIAIFLALMAGILCGLFNGFFVTYLRVPSLIVTIGTLSLFGGLAAVINPLTRFFEGNYPVYSAPITANILGVPLSFALFVLITAILWWLTTKVSFGHYLYYTGSNRRAAWMSGVPVNRIRITAFVISGFCAALSGYLLSAQIGNAAVNIGTGKELTAIAIAVVSGVSLFGGKGSIPAVMIGTLTLGVFINMLALARLGTYFSQAMQGVLIITVVLLFGVLSRATTREGRL